MGTPRGKIQSTRQCIGLLKTSSATVFLLSVSERQLVEQAVDIRETSVFTNALIAGPCPRLDASCCSILSAMTSKHISNLFIHLSFAGPAAHTHLPRFSARESLETDSSAGCETGNDHALELPWIIQ